MQAEEEAQRVAIAEARRRERERLQECMAVIERGRFHSLDRHLRGLSC